LYSSASASADRTKKSLFTPRCSKSWTTCPTHQQMRSWQSVSAWAV
jgi:hypothetical protein